MKRECLADSLQKVITVNDVMDKFGCGRTKALEIMKVPELHGYHLGKSVFVERQYWDAYIEDLINVGGTNKLAS